jgi:hypothetical protein
MRKSTAALAIVIAVAAFMTPVAMANVRALHLCCPPKVQSKAAQQDAMDHCGHDGMAPGSTPALQSEMTDCSRHMLSTAAPGVVHATSPAVVGRPRASHPILDEFAPILANEANQSSQKDRAPPANGQ